MLEDYLENVTNPFITWCEFFVIDKCGKLILVILLDVAEKFSFIFVAICFRV